MQVHIKLGGPPLPQPSEPADPARCHPFFSFLGPGISTFDLFDLFEFLFIYSLQAGRPVGPSGPADLFSFPMILASSGPNPPDCLSVYT